MKVAMVKHPGCGKTFWFEVPEGLENIAPGVGVVCDTARGRERGTLISTPFEYEDVKDIMASSGATFPLRRIVRTVVVQEVDIGEIKIPGYMEATAPGDDKIAKRFLEYYHTGKFNTRVVVGTNRTLLDGYAAYLVAKKIGLPTIEVTVKGEIQ